MIEALRFEFMQNALLAGFLVSLACGIIGSYVVVKRMVFVSGGIAHAAYGGIGLGYFFGFEPILGAVIFALGGAWAMGAAQQHRRERTDTLIGVLWALGMAIGIILIDMTRGYKADLMGYLFGSILAIPRTDLWIMAGLDIAIVAVTVLFFKEFLAVSFDETFARVAGVPVAAVNLILLSLIALSVVMMMRVVGLIMVIALLTIPAAVAGRFVRDLGRMMILATALGFVFTLGGLWLSHAWDLTSGAAVILVAGAAYMLSLLRRRTDAAGAPSG